MEEVSGKRRRKNRRRVNELMYVRGWRKEGGRRDGDGDQ